MGDIATLVGAGGAGLLAIVILYLLSGNRADRQQYEDLVDRAEARADAAEERLRAAHDELDEARTARRAAEDRADQMARKLDRLGGGP